ncbi:hypothetical protein SLEP1_g45437 [Rubroshorea leprosula]|uniref:Uncharacterized protein n=1 Tax=Rubroshorea leprosula TaxID=152421 RepID=A0AAV5LJ04_9ROSI|nr:hypothetical protein SLEP1_g45437 [Rubroshorea leprosula]
MEEEWPPYPPCANGHCSCNTPKFCATRKRPPSRRHQPLRNRKASGSALLCFFTTGCSCLMEANWPGCWP